MTVHYDAYFFNALCGIVGILIGLAVLVGVCIKFERVGKWIAASIVLCILLFDLVQCAELTATDHRPKPDSNAEQP